MKDDNRQLVWQRADHCESGGCVEIAAAGGEVFVRNSNDPGGPSLRFTKQEWEEFTSGVRADQFNLD